MPLWFYEPRFILLDHWISLAGVAAFAVFVTVGFLLSAAIQSDLVRRWFTKFGIDKAHVGVVTATVALMALVGCSVAGLDTGGIPINWDARIPGLSLSLLVVLRLLILLALAFWFSAWAKRFFFTRFLSTSGLDRALQYTIAQIVGYLILIVVAALVFQNAGIDLSALAVFAGALGVGLGFGLQDITRNFISGLIILLERPIRIGDRVEVDKVAGQVRRIRARSTTVVTNDNIAMIVPNSLFVTSTVTNWSHDDPRVRFRIPVGVAYGSDLEKVRAVLLAVAAANEHALKTPEPSVFFSGFGDSSLDFELAVWSDEMSYRPRRFRSDLNFAIERGLREAGIEIPFPQRDLHIRSGSIDATAPSPADVSPA